MLDGFKVGGLKDLNTMASWSLGTAVIVLVAALALGAAAWSLGKAGKSARWTTGALKTCGLAVLGSMLLGSVSGGIKLFSGNQGTKGMMIEAAQPRDITIHRNAPTTSCVNRVTWQHPGFTLENPTWSQDQHKPGDYEHAYGVNLIDNLGAWHWTPKKVSGKTLNNRWGGNFSESDWKDLDKALNVNNRVWKVAKAEWYPNGKNKADCTADNKHAGPNTNVIVWIWEGRADGQASKATMVDGAMYRVFEFDSGEKPPTKDVKFKEPKKSDDSGNNGGGGDWEQSDDPGIDNGDGPAQALGHSSASAARTDAIGH